MSQTELGAALREEMGIAADPDFELQLLPGWVRRTPDDDDLAEREAALKQRFMRLHRPDLFAEARSMLRESHTVMAREHVIAYYVAEADADTTLWVPGSILVTVRHPPEGGSLDQVVAQAIREYGAAPLFGDKRFVRFQRERTRDLGADSVVLRTITYMTPVPGTRRRRALQLTASFGWPAGMSEDDPKVVGITTAFDMCVSTLRWLPPGGSTT